MATRFDYRVVKQNLDGTTLVEREMKYAKGTKSKLIQYDLFIDPEAFNKGWTASKGDDRAFLYECYRRGRDLAARAAESEAPAVKTTIVKVKGKDFDLASLPVSKQVALFNAKVLEASTIGSKVPGAVIYAAELLVEAGKAHFQNGSLVVGPAAQAGKK